MTSFRLLSYNIHKGFSVGNQQFILAGIRSAIRETGADIACLQEVVGDHQHHSQNISGWHPGGQFEFLADEVWHHYTYGKNAIYEHGHHGNAILSKYPFTDYQNIDITRWRFSQRGILHGRIGPSLHILCIHFGFLPDEQHFQLRCLLAMIKEHIPAHHGLIVAGDFNDWHQRIHSSLTRKLGMTEALCDNRCRPLPTYPARRPRLAMDRVYYRNVKCTGGEVLRHPHWRSLSDHCPLLVDFEYDQPLVTGRCHD